MDIKEGKKKSWFRRHPVLTVIAIIILLPLILGLISGIFGINNNGTNNGLSNSNSANPTASNNVNAQVNIPSYEQKTSGYTEAECEQVCNDAYDIQAQVDMCQSSCQMMGKPSATLDKYVNTVKQKIQNASG